MNKLEKYVKEFHEKFGCSIGDSRNPNFKDHALRKNLINEECGEFVNAVNWGRFDEAVRECLDILYVTTGTLIAFGITDIDRYLEELHRANMNKTNENKRPDGKITKPAGWQPPRIPELIQAQRDGTFFEKGPSLSQRMEDDVIDFDKPHLNTPIIPQETIDKINVEINDEKIVEAITKETKKRGRPKGSN